ncbi:MAG: hypothetical protein GY814_09190 [Gammaproteobacteria bacterium]|nr:hypothetical protein [Gammaproteobacteria bacterium]
MIGVADPEGGNQDGFHKRSASNDRPGKARPEYITREGLYRSASIYWPAQTAQESSSPRFPPNVLALRDS